MENKKQETEAYVYLSNSTNSTMFTTCCDVAICSDQQQCPKCKKYVYGHEVSSYDRQNYRWRYAYKK